MKKYFIINDEEYLNKERQYASSVTYFKKAMGKVVEEMQLDKANIVWVYKDSIRITFKNSDDKNRFSNDIMKNGNLKKSSIWYKRFYNLVDEEIAEGNIIRLHRPIPSLDLGLKLNGKISHSSYILHDKCYAFIGATHDFELPESCVEIKEMDYLFALEQALTDIYF